MVHENYYKILLFLFVMLLGFFNNSFTQSKVIMSPKVSFDLLGRHSLHVSDKTGEVNVVTGISIGAELLLVHKNISYLGFGLMYLVPRNQDVKGSGNFSFLPMYLLFKLDMLSKGEVIPSIVVNLGYNIIYSGDSIYKGPLNLGGRLYLGGGFRLTYNNIFFEGLYKSFNGNAIFNGTQNRNIEFDVTYTTLSVGLGLLI